MVKKEPKFFKKLTPNDIRFLPDTDVTDWDIKDIEKSTLIRFNPPTARFWEKVDHIIDWLSDLVILKGINALQQLRGIQTLDLASQHANKYFADKNKKASEVVDSVEAEGTQTILKFR